MTDNVRHDFSGKKALIMGLGLHGGGLSSAVFLAKHGAKLTVTDLRTADILRPSIERLDETVRALGAAPVEYTLGRHEIDDFRSADIVVKNPGVRPDSPYLQAARWVETDISLFLRANPSRLTAVTGTKGKSFTAAALQYVLDRFHKAEGNGAAYLGGNITISPLDFLEQLTCADDVVLELSSWQLGDLPQGLLKPRAAVITAIMEDHLDRYGTMERYIADKKRLYENQDAQCLTVVHEGAWGDLFLKESAARKAVYGRKRPCGDGGWYDAERGVCFVKGAFTGIKEGEIVEITGAESKTPGIHQKINALGAGLALLDLGLSPQFIRETFAGFPGLEHRLEFFEERDGIRFYNDSAATIPEAAAAACDALETPVLVTGGTDKALDFTPLVKAARKAKKVILLAGTASDKLAPLLAGAGIPCDGPYDNLDAALAAVYTAARAGDIVVLSPGCASFGMFRNEFDRGRRWKEAVRGYRIT